jgi:DNA-binding MarR family transcriptional regulator
MSATPNEAGAELLEVVPQLMRAIRDQMRQHRVADLSVPEFRTLGFLNQHPGASLTAVADHIGLTLPAMSKMMDGLVARSLVKREREFDAIDRRCVTLALTTRGRTVLESARATTQAYLAEVLAALSPAERTTVMEAMRVLSPLFSPEREKERMLAREHNGHS